jgi:2-hydroxychromene-2-carboxylate isomerase
MPRPVAVPKHADSSDAGQRPPEVRFYFDIVCPYAYLASTQIEDVCARAGARLDYRPILLGGVLKALGSEPMAAPARAAMIPVDLRRWSEHLGVPLRFPAEHPRRTVEAMRLLSWAPRLLRAALMAALYRAYWVEGRDVSDLQVLGEIAESVGLTAASAILGIQTPAASAELRRSTDEALTAGVFGVPTFVVDTHAGPRLFFGQDRLHFVEEALRNHPGSARGPQPEAQNEPHALALTRDELNHPEAVANQARRVLFFYDLASPFSYLAATQIEALAARCGAEVEWRPILIGGLFKRIGTPLVPISTYPEPKRRHSIEDMTRWARYYDVPFAFPSRFPMVTVAALRLLHTAAEYAKEQPKNALIALTHELFRAYWAADQDLNDPEVLLAALDRTGLPRELFERTSDPAIKQRLLDATTEAEQLGVFGVPSFIVPAPGGAPELFFGQDRLLFVEKALRRGPPHPAR